MNQTRILFICHGNICRSVAAEMVMRQLVREAGLEKRISAASAAATDDELGHDIYPPMKRTLERHGVICTPHAARRITREDYRRYDLIIGMDGENLSDMRRIFGGDPEGRLSLMMDWAGEPGRPVADPWYTRDFEAAYRDVKAGCEGLLDRLARDGERV